MAIDDGNVANADDVMNALGSNFNDTAQNLFNAAYIGFDSRLNNTGSPNLKNVFYSTFTSDDVDEKYNIIYDGTNDYYVTQDLTSANIVYMDIYATSVNIATLSDSANNLYCVKMGEGVWRLYSWNGVVAENVNRIFTKMFDQLADGATDPNGVTGLTQLRFSESTYRDKNVISLRGRTTQSSTTSGYVEATLSGTDSNTAYLIGDYVSAQESTGDSTAYINSPVTTTIHSVSNKSSIDHRNTSIIHSIVSCNGLRCGGSTSSGTNQSWNSSGILIFSSTLTSSKTTSGTFTINNLSSEFTISSSAPDIATYPLTQSTLIFKDTTSTSVTNAIPVINSTIDATSSEQISVSADGGSNWTNVNNTEIVRPTAGTALWRRIVITRTDLSTEDKVTEQACKYNYY